MGMASIAESVLPTTLPERTPARLLVGLWLGVSGALALARLGYELNPLALSGLGSAIYAAALGLLGAVVGAALVVLLARQRPALRVSALAFPAALLWLYILHGSENVQPTQGVILALATAGVLLVAYLSQIWTPLKSSLTLQSIGAGLIPFVVYLIALQPVVGRADTFEFQVTLPVLGLAHPTGYPLYTMLGFLFSQLPIGSIALRINLLSAIYGAIACMLLYYTLRRYLKLGGIISLIAVLQFAFCPVVFSQSVIAEVYTSHAAFVAALLALAFYLTDPQAPAVRKATIALLALTGFSMANHLTTFPLLPGIVLAVLLARSRGSLRRSTLVAGIGLMLLAVSLLDAYIPLRWTAITHTPMSLQDFIWYITGTRYVGALILDAWLHDPERYRIVLRVLLEQFGTIGTILTAFGWIILLWRKPAYALISVLFFAGTTFFCLNYYVPDLASFMLPMLLLESLWMGYGVHVAAQFIRRRWLDRRGAGWLVYALFTALAVLPLQNLWTELPQYTWQGEKDLLAWGQYTLSLPLAQNSIILADSEKIAPLEYLHRIEGVRPDVEIMVLNTEEQYLQELYQRLQAGQTVYLARQLPGLEGEYHLRSLGTLVEVGQSALTTLPENAASSPRVWQNGITLLADQLDASVPQGDTAHLTLYWQSDAAVHDVLDVQLQLVDASGAAVWQSRVAHPVSGWYPTNAWKPPEIVPDYHDIPIGYDLPSGDYSLQVRLVPPFSRDAIPTASGEAWETVGSIHVASTPGAISLLDRQTAIAYPGGAVTGVALTDYRTLDDQAVTLRLNTSATTGLLHVPAAQSGVPLAQVGANALSVVTTSPTPDQLHWSLSGDGLYCGWFTLPTTTCDLGQTALRASLPAGTIANFQNSVALTDMQFKHGALIPGETSDLLLQWQALQPIAQNYTVFVQFIGPDGHVHGQVDQAPLQGTYPTNEWKAGEMLNDPYRLTLAPDAPSGDYQIAVGFYLLSTGERLLLYDEADNPIGDAVLQSGVFVN